MRNSRTRPFISYLKGNKGQNLVEFALVVPWLLIIVFGIAEFGRAWMTQNILTGAAREAVRLLAVPEPAGGVTVANARAVAVLASAGITTANIDVDDAAAFGEVRVTITYDFPITIAGFVPGLDTTTISLSSRTTMRREY